MLLRFHRPGYVCSRMIIELVVSLLKRGCGGSILLFSLEASVCQSHIKKHRRLFERRPARSEVAALSIALHQKLNTHIKATVLVSSDCMRATFERYVR